MHEMSLVRSLLTQVERLAAEHAATAVTEIEVEIGPLSGVEPVLVREAFDLLVATSAVPHATLKIDQVPLLCRCGDCRQQFELVSFRFKCPHCGSTEVQITSGDQFRLLNVTIETEQPAEQV
jgi:hydrogenase nickel incorporation protein HypA/HybF